MPGSLKVDTMVQNEPLLPDAIAAIDLGSNSFHMVVARPRGGELVIVDRIRDMVRLAAGLDGEQRMAADATERALQCLTVFGQRLRHLPAGTVRAVGTNTLRLATNSEEFLAGAEQALGHPIEIISGVEEARLIYQGVARSLSEDGKRRLVMDIGGGSTEFIIGERFEPLHMESMPMGCVTLTQTYFPEGEITPKGARSAELAALMQIEPYQAIYQGLGWDDAIGASGTIRAVHRVIRESRSRRIGRSQPILTRASALRHASGSCRCRPAGGCRSRGAYPRQIPAARVAAKRVYPYSRRSSHESAWRTSKSDWGRHRHSNRQGN